MKLPEPLTSQASCLDAQTVGKKTYSPGTELSKVFFPEAGTQVRYADNFLMPQILAQWAAVF